MTERSIAHGFEISESFYVAHLYKTHTLCINETPRSLLPPSSPSLIERYAALTTTNRPCHILFYKSSLFTPSLFGASILWASNL
jgi:hypothetical protein